MQYSPKLKSVADQIKQILRDNDVAGYVVLHTPGFSEHLIEITPSYSCLEWNALKNNCVIKGMVKHYGGDRQLRDQKLADTINMLKHFSDVIGSHALNFMSTSENADHIWNATHHEGGQTSQQQQNN